LRGGVPKAAAFCLVTATPLTQRTVSYFKTPFLYTRPQLLFSQKDAHPTPLTELPSTPQNKTAIQHNNKCQIHTPKTGHFHIKSMPKCGNKFGAALTAGF
jgi:hypothetical protein